MQSQCLPQLKALAPFMPGWNPVTAAAWFSPLSIYSWNGRGRASGHGAVATMCRDPEVIAFALTSSLCGPVLITPCKCLSRSSHRPVRRVVDLGFRNQSLLSGNAESPRTSSVFQPFMRSRCALQARCGMAELLPLAHSSSIYEHGPPTYSQCCLSPAAKTGLLFI